MRRHSKRAARPALPEPRPATQQTLSFLEPGQLVAGTQRPVPRAPLSTRVRAALWGLRIFVIIVSAMVIYTFFSQLGR
jgi:hypothetical protein